jgi:hypothetical protein
MARAHRKGSRKAHARSANRKSRSHRKGSRKAHRKTAHRMRGGEAPVNYANPEPMALSLAQGKQFGAYHADQHGGAVAYGPYPGAVTEPSVLPANLVGPAHLLPLNAAFAEIRQFGPESDLKGGARRKARKSRKTRKASRKGSRKAHRKGSRSAHSKGSRSAHSKGSRSAHRKQRGGDFVRWGGGKSRKANRKAYKGGAYAELRFPMPVADETKMLIPPQLQEQAGLNPEWKLAESPLSFAPKY